ncbi:MAG: hypothetical protein HY289_04400 [Planctomycetes bacterium]|nr:hypothetical protein [Planctomycetota bacterium]
MTEIAIDKEKRPIAEWLPRGNSNELVYLTRRGRKKFVVVPLDDMDQEVMAIRKNAALMAHIHELSERARKGPTKSIDEVRAELGIPRRKKKSKR